MRALPLVTLTFLLAGSACSQTSPSDASEAARPPTRPDLYRCDGCEAAAERSADELLWQVDLPPEGEPGERLILSGRVLLPDGETPAPGVVLYFHQTNASGLYRSVRSTSRGGRADGMIEGWLATDSTGRYEVRTIKPAPYPGGGMPAHIHIYVKEPGRRPYYIDDVVLASDPLVTKGYREAQELRGGSGIVRLRRDADGAWHGARDIVLEW